MAKHKIVIVGAEVVGKDQGVKIYAVEVGKEYEITVDKIPLGVRGYISFVPGRDGNPDGRNAAPQEDGGNPKLGTAHLTYVFPDFTSGTPEGKYMGTLRASYPDGEDFEQAGSILVLVHFILRKEE